MSSGGGAAATMQGGIEGRAVLPAAPDDAEPGAGQDPDGISGGAPAVQGGHPFGARSGSPASSWSRHAWRCFASDPSGSGLRPGQGFSRAYRRDDRIRALAIRPKIARDSPL